MTRQKRLEEIVECGAVIILRLSNAENIVPVADAIVRGGISAVEVTLNTPNALDSIFKLNHALGNDILLGAGTVLNADDAVKAIQAGAKYIISPVFKPELIDVAHSHDCPFMPGCLTPTEMLLAHEAGSDMIKFFPADALGPAYMKAALAPLQNLKIMPTGGIHAGNAGEWIHAGAACLGVGSAIMDKSAIAEKRFHVIAEKARLLKNEIEEARQRNPQ